MKKLLLLVIFILLIILVTCIAIKTCLNKIIFNRLKRLSNNELVNVVKLNKNAGTKKIAKRIIEKRMLKVVEDVEKIYLIQIKKK